MRPSFLIAACAFGSFLYVSTARAQSPAIAEVPDPELQSLIRDLEREIEGKVIKTTQNRHYDPTDAMAKMGPRAEPAIPMLIRTMKEGKIPWPGRAASALGQIGSAAVPDLIALLDHPRLETRWQAHHGLRYIGPDAKAAVPRLLELLESKDPKEQRRVIETLGAVGWGTDEKLVAALLKLTKSDEEHVRYQAMLGLATLKPAPNEAEPMFLGILKDPKSSDNLRIVAIQGLATISPLSKEAVPVLKKELATDNVMVLGYVLGAMQNAGALKDTIPALIKLLKTIPEPPKELKGDARYAFVYVHKWARWNAVTILSGFKKEEPDTVLPILKHVAENDPDEEVRSWAARVLEPNDESEK